MTKSKNIISLLTLSSTFEYYDFIIYGLMSSYLGAVFFPQENVLAGQMQAFLLFSLGYIIRPFGGIILAMFGDTYNIKKIFVRSNFVLAGANIFICLMPSYSKIGAVAGVMILILRMIQAITFAVELPGTMHFIKYVTNEKSSRNFGFILSGTSIGAFLAAMSLYFLEKHFSYDEIIDYAWRMPFAFGSVLCLVSIFLRTKLPEIKQDSYSKIDLLKLVSNEHKKIISFILMILVSAFLVLMNIFFPSFLKEFYGYSKKEIFLAMTISLVFSAIFSLVISNWFNKINKIIFIKFVIAITIPLALVINFLFLRYSFEHLVIGLCFYQAIITSIVVTVFPLMAETFQPHIRFTLMTICYNITYAIAAIGPILSTKLSDKWHSPFGMWFILILLCIMILANLNKFLEEE